jgi:hypothetical protein
MAFIARWSFDARFGHKDAAIALCKKWNLEFGQQAGFGKPVGRSGSIGARESHVELDCTFESLADLEKAFANIGKLQGHAAWGKEFEPHIVSGSNKWEIFRPLDVG